MQFKVLKENKDRKHLSGSGENDERKRETERKEKRDDEKRRSWEVRDIVQGRRHWGWAWAEGASPSQPLSSSTTPFSGAKKIFFLGKIRVDEREGVGEKSDKK